MKEEILKDFKSKKKTFDSFKDRMINLIRDLLEKENITPHQITGRTKETTSLSKKIDKKEEKYNTLNDITDVVGLRIITYLESEVDPIATIIEREFEKDKENSIDKRILKNDQFGYRSLHVVVSLNDKRSKLPEYSKYKSIKCEIQIRSILQHGWAEIEHDLGYKGVDIPDDYKRSFNRVAALLELADIEFVKLKLALDNYEKDVPELIETRPEEVDINKASINSFVNTNKIISEAKEMIIKSSGFPMLPSSDNEGNIRFLKFFNIKTIKNLEELLKANKQEFFAFTRQFIIEGNIKQSLYEGVILMYFAHFLAAKTEDISLIDKYLDKFSFTRNDNDAEGFRKLYHSSKN